MHVLSYALLEDGRIFPRHLEYNTAEHKLLQFAIPHLVADSI